MNRIIYFALFALIYSSSAFAQRGNNRTLFTNGRAFQHQTRQGKPNQPPPPPPPGPNQDNHTEFRTIDGTNNNLSNTEFGATDIPLSRSIDSDYGTSDFFNAMGGATRPSARAVSNAVSGDTDDAPSRYGLSSFVFTWGQFIDHDVDLTGEGHTEYEPILMPANEPLFNSPIPFFRSAIYGSTGVTDYRQQENLITSWIDGSNVYGSDEDRANWLRTFQGGKLKTSTGNLLPFNTINGEYSSAIDPNAPSMAGDNGGTTVTFVAGDVRAAEQPGLTSLHTLFVREHNRIAENLSRGGMRNDEEIYQTARKQVGGLIQSITYNEFMPSLGIQLDNYRGYRVDIRPDVSNIFATAAYRFGHTMVTKEMLLLDDDCRNVDQGSLTLLQAFFNPDVLRTYGIEPIFNGLAAQVQNEIDLKITDNLRNFLFGDPNAPVVVGLDLASLNIQRGRDHGLPDYNTVRKEYTGRAARNFRDITSDQQLADALEDVYDGDLENIDLWVGLLAEDHRRNSTIGNTMYEILKKQFQDLRDADYYYYENDRFLDRRAKDDIDRTRLSNIIERNTTINDIQGNVFRAVACSGVGNRTSNISTNMELKFDEALAVFPNPAIEQIFVKTQDEGTLKIFDLRGKMIKNIGITNASEETISIAIDDLKSGVYILNLTTNSESISKKFSKVDY